MSVRPEVATRLGGDSAAAPDAGKQFADTTAVENEPMPGDLADIVAKFEYSSRHTCKCGEGKPLLLPETFGHVEIAVTNYGDCSVVLEVRLKTGDRTELRAMATADPGKSCSVSVDNANDIEFSCHSAADKKCQFSFSIRAVT